MKLGKIAAAGVSIILGGQALWAMPSSLEGRRNEGGLKFGEMKLSGNVSTGSLPRISGEFRAVETAKPTRRASQYDSIKLKAAVPPLKDNKESNAAKTGKKGAGYAAGGIVGGLIGAVAGYGISSAIISGTGATGLAAAGLAVGGAVAVGGGLIIGAAIGIGIAAALR